MIGIIKDIGKMAYMALWHPYLFWKYTIKSRFFMYRGGNLKRIKKMVVGKNVRFGYGTRISFYDNSDNPMLCIGDNTYIVNRCSLIVGGKITIGRDVLIGSDVCIVSENHSIDPTLDIPYMNQKIVLGEIIIGDGVWIGDKALILPNIIVGDKAVVAGGAVVTQSVPPRSIVAGNPAKIIKVFNDENGKWERVNV